MSKAIVEKGSSRKYLVALAVCLLSLGGIGIGNGTLSLFVVPVTEALGIARSAYSMYETVGMIVGLIISLLFAPIYKKLGAKVIATLAGLGWVVFFLCLAFATNVYVIWFGGIFQGIGYALSGALLFFAILPPWFPKTAGKWTGIAGSMSGIGASVVIQLGAHWISNYGYRQALIFEAIMIAIMCAVAVVLIKINPDDPVGGSKVLEAEKAGLVPKEERVGGLNYYKRMLSSPAILVSTIIFFIVGGLANAFTQITLPIFASRGLAMGPVILSTSFIVLIFGKIGGGIVRDKFGVKVLTPIIVIAYIAAILMVGFGPETILTSFLIGIGAVIGQIWPPYILMATTGKYYDAGMVGIGEAIYKIGRAIIIPLAHLPYDLYGSYNITIIAFVILTVAVWILSMVSIRIGKTYQAKRDSEEAAKTVSAKTSPGQA